MRDVRRYSWSDRRTSSQYKTKTVTHNRVSMASPDLTILFCGDAKEWAHYLTQTFCSHSGPQALPIHQERLENLIFPLPSVCAQSFTSAKVVLVILSPASLDFIDSHAEVFELGKLLRPNQTVAMLCGVNEGDITSFHKAALVSYDAWPRFVARDQDRECVENVLGTTFEFLKRAQESQAYQKPQFKVSPRKVNEGNRKVFVILDRAIRVNQKVQVLLEGNGVHELPVKKRNPYTLQFVVPGPKAFPVDYFMCDDYFLGVRALKCESKIGELYTLLQNVNSPYEMLRQTMGVASCSEVDNLMVKNFQRNLPPIGFNMLDPDVNLDLNSEEELPTLLHFSSKYGLRELTSQLLQCAGAARACRLQNVSGCCPAQLAKQEGHNDIARLLDDFEKLTESEGYNVFLDGNVESDYENDENMDSHIYDVPFPVPIPSIFGNLNDVSITKSEMVKRRGHIESHYLEMEADYKSQYSEKLVPQDKVILENGKERPDEIAEDREPKLSSPPLEPSITDEMSNQHGVIVPSTGHSELLDILESYKRGAKFSEVEQMFREWQMCHIVPSKKSIEILKKLREIYKKSEKQGCSRKESKTFCELQNTFTSKLGRRQIILAQGQQSSKDSRISDGAILATENEKIRSQLLSSSSFTSSSSSSSVDGVSILSTYDSENDSGDDVVSSQNDLKMKKMITLVEGQVKRPPVPPPRPPNLQKSPKGSSSSTGKFPNQLLDPHQQMANCENLNCKNVPHVRVSLDHSDSSYYNMLPQNSALNKKAEYVYYNIGVYNIKTSEESAENTTNIRGSLPTFLTDHIPQESSERLSRRRGGPVEYKSAIERTNSERSTRSTSQHVPRYRQLKPPNSSIFLNQLVSTEANITQFTKQKKIVHGTNNPNCNIPSHPSVPVIVENRLNSSSFHHDYAVPRKLYSTLECCEDNKKVHNKAIIRKPALLSKNSSYSLLPSKPLKNTETTDKIPHESPLPPPPLQKETVSVESETRSESLAPVENSEAPPLPPRGITAPRPQETLDGRLECT
ncbi:uncharacterized protein LOC106460337 [Limulus polyphemus]|uniref:Uncharacterized protein LOC106460337 n=1 Tax=Limulus polyphemus TaxID=6850 RepID=A0ABM1B604_LIMPO|nr:uncharacterized protein LOC106460337 [Limulus polyphemus]